MKRMLELGCGTNPRYNPEFDEYYALEYSQEAAGVARERLRLDGHNSETHHVLQHKVGYENFPFQDDYFDFVLADQFLEHIPRQGFFKDPWNKVHEINPVIWCLNECWRVAKHGACVQFNVPKWDSAEMWQDPTHVNPVPPQFWVYFGELDPWDLKASYGIRAKLNLMETIDGGWYHVFKLQAVKP